MKKKKNMEKNVYATADVDGTIAAVNSYNDDNGRFDNALLPCFDADLNEFSKSGNIYAKAKALKTMKFVLSLFSFKKIWFLTTSEENVEIHKENFLTNNFSTKKDPIKKDHIIHVRSSNYKVEEVEKLYNSLQEKNNNKPIFLMVFEDDFDRCLQIEDTLRPKGLNVKAIHISYFVA